MTPTPLQGKDECTLWIAENMLAKGILRGTVNCPVHGHHNPYDMYKKSLPKNPMTNLTSILEQFDKEFSGNITIRNDVKSFISKEFTALVEELEGEIKGTKVLETLAAIEHERWSSWQIFLHSLCLTQRDGSLLIPSENVYRWKRQISTPYDELSEKEKQSDRDQVMKYLPIFLSLLNQYKQ